jgi:hypothetical protein
MIRVWHFGFHRPVYSKPSLIFGHCEAWGMGEDETWTFIDPQGAGMKVYTAFRYDDVACQIQARLELCSEIITYPAPSAAFRLPLHGLMTCAAICGSLVGIRALLPNTLRHRLLANGGKVYHEAQREPGGQSGSAS